MIPIVTYAEVERDPKLRAIFIRELTFTPEIEATVRTIIDDVRKRGDAAVIEYTNRFDHVLLETLAPVPVDELRELHSRVDGEFLQALRESIENIRRFHELQVRRSIWMEGPDDVRMGLRYVPLEAAGLYVPGGAGAYPSTIVMNAVPAQAAGVERLVVVTPPGQFRENPHVAAALVELGIGEVYTIGGAQAVAALAYGTESIQRVDKIVGPGNAWVQTAKKLVFGHVDIDMFAGPSEIVVVADENANPAFVAADLLSQAEHGSGMEMAVLLTPSEHLAAAVREELYLQAGQLEHSDTVKKVLEANALIIVEDLGQAVNAVNRIAPEHLELMVKDPSALLETIRNAGAVFLGEYSPEPVSDYFAGPNHVLPTSGAARYASPLGVYDFQKCMNVVEYSRAALLKHGDKIDRLARSEGFTAHARAVTIRNRGR